MQLLRITTTPSQLEFNSQRAHLEYNVQPLGFTLENTGGSLEVNVSPTRMSMNSDAFRSDMNMGTSADNSAKFAQRGKEAARDATARHVDLGNQMMAIHKGANIPDLLFSRMMQDSSTNLVLMPLRPIDISWSVPQITMNYNPVKQNFDWQIAKNVLEYVPGKLSIDVKQYSQVNIEYLGEPCYVPPRKPSA